MSWTVRDVMRTDVRTVDPETTLVELDRLFVADGVSGFPVVDRGRLVGIVSRSDVVRHIGVEESVAESVSDYYCDVRFEENPVPSLAGIGRQVGERLAEKRVKDVMVEKLITAEPDEPLEEAARRLVERRIHRLPVVDGGRLVGIISTLDLVRLIAAGRARPA